MLSRRQFLNITGSASIGLLTPSCHKQPLKSSSAHIVIIGGGFGGATAAKTIKKLDPTIQVTLIEPNSHYISCPGSNWVFADFKKIHSLVFNYSTLSRLYHVNVIHQVANHIDPKKQSITLNNQQEIHYDRLIISPGIDFQWNNISGHNASTSHLIPHAWKAGQQTILLNNQIKNMRNGGTVIICAPPNPFRCPPGPYERASMIAHYLKRHKPRSKILILDHKSQFSKQTLFIAGWKKYYGYGTSNSLIEWHSMPDNPIINIDVKKKILESDFGDKFTADVINYIPPQKAGNIAFSTGLCDDTGWCPVTHQTSESTIHPKIHVIGDASTHSPLPKSAFAANAEAKTCAFSIVNILNNQPLLEPTWINTCYSLLTEDQGISVAMVYKLNSKGKIYKVEGAGGISKKTDKQSLSYEATYAKQWLKNITLDSFF
ncbi:MAG: FAD-dependent oxidoreductase [Methylococcales bacterium]|nr:FAD-dependent oxidoreductase [Methylococcales bacterium]